ncbi:hypothetical protein LXA43DRAFT_36654 [Ganoderma leucocontextum]|nr:hypothetical protein LXA43DRAFT_36654 [Ganoderma leucocontextum]
MWLLFIVDLRLHPHPDDVELTGTRVSNMELADDMTLASLSPAGAQRSGQAQLILGLHSGHVCSRTPRGHWPSLGLRPDSS